MSHMSLKPHFDHETRLLHITESAVRRLTNLLSAENEQRLRIRVDSGGCVGLQYSFDLDETVTEDDHIYHVDQSKNIAVILDDISLELIKGAVLDFSEDMMGALFTIKNPQATTSCGCGNSFSLV